jgi:hypothetical protein
VEESGLHSGLEIRLRSLELRIARLKQDMGKAIGLAKFEGDGEIESLDKRHKLLEDQLRELDREGPGFRQDVKAEIDKMADDLTGSLVNFYSGSIHRRCLISPIPGIGLNLTLWHKPRAKYRDVRPDRFWEA